MHERLGKTHAPQGHGRSKSKHHGIAPDLAVLGTQLEELRVFFEHQIHGGAEAAVLGHHSEEHDKDHDSEEHALHGVDPGRALHAAHHEIQDNEGRHKKQAHMIGYAVLAHGLDHAADALNLSHQVGDRGHQYHDGNDDPHFIAVAFAIGCAHGHPLARPAEEEGFAMHEIPEIAQGHKIHAEHEQGAETRAVAQTGHAEHAEGAQERGQHAEDQDKVSEARSGHKIIVCAARESLAKGQVADKDRDEADSGDNGNGKHQLSSLSAGGTSSLARSDRISGSSLSLSA